MFDHFFADFFYMGWPWVVTFDGFNAIAVRMLLFVAVFVVAVVVVLVVAAVVVVVVFVVVTFTRIISSVVTGQAQVPLEWKNTTGKNTSKPKAVHAYIIAEAVHASAKK